MEKITTYKGFDKDLKCLDFQYEVGKTYHHEGAVVACKSGFHACENPLDVWAFYPLAEGNRFCRVTQSAAIKEGTKTVSAVLTVEKEIALGDMIVEGVRYLAARAEEKTSGYGSTLAASGNNSTLAASGNNSRLAASGNNSRLAASGNYSRLAVSGDYSRLAASGNNSRLAASGYGSTLAASGDYGTLAASGNGSRAKAGENGAIALVYHDGSRPRFALGYVGEDGIKPDTWYKADTKTGKLVEC
jgi:hypothetical protein